MVSMAARLHIIFSCLPLAFLGACGSGGQSAKCVPGASAACSCPTGKQGSQTCTSEGAYAACVCAVPNLDAGSVGGAGGAPTPPSTGAAGGQVTVHSDASSGGSSDVPPTAQPDTPLAYQDTAPTTRPEVAPEVSKEGGMESRTELLAEMPPEPAPELAREQGGETGPESVVELSPEPVPEPGPDVTDAGTGSAPESVDAPPDLALAQGWVDRTNQTAASAGSWPMLSPGPTMMEGPMVFDTHRNKTVMFAGLDRMYSAWEWDGSAGTWYQRAWTAGVNSPTSRTKFAVAYDATREKVILVGGYTGEVTPSGETWEWDGESASWGGTWTQKASGPGGWRHAMAYDESTGRVVLFGGEVFNSSSKAALPDLWEYDGTTDTWTNRTPNPLPDSWPQARMDHALAYDPSRGKTVLCGGVTEALGLLDEVWDWDSTQGTWTNRTPTPLPADRPYGCSPNGFAYSGNGKMAIFVGGSYPTATRNFYQWDGVLGTWTNMAPSPLPTSWPPYGSYRPRPSLAWDSTRSKVVMTGGLVVHNTNTSEALNDTWEWSGP